MLTGRIVERQRDVRTREWHCGESYLTADTLHELDRLKAHRRSLACDRSVPVVAFR